MIKLVEKKIKYIDIGHELVYTTQIQTMGRVQNEYKEILKLPGREKYALIDFDNTVNYPLKSMEDLEKYLGCSLNEHIQKIKKQ